MRAWSWIGLIPLAAACTATRISYHVVRAQEALDLAEVRGAVEAAPYEFTMARQYLMKSRDEVSQSQYKVASALARQSSTWSERAVAYVDKQQRPDAIEDDLIETDEPPPKTEKEEFEL